MRKGRDRDALSKRWKGTERKGEMRFLNGQENRKVAVVFEEVVKRLGTGRG